MDKVAVHQKISDFCKVFDIPIELRKNVSKTEWTFYPNSGCSQTLTYIESDNITEFIYRDEDGQKKEFKSLKIVLVHIISG